MLKEEIDIVHSITNLEDKVLAMDLVIKQIVVVTIDGLDIP